MSIIKGTIDLDITKLQSLFKEVRKSQKFMSKDAVEAKAKIDDMLLAALNSTKKLTEEQLTFMTALTKSGTDYAVMAKEIVKHNQTINDSMQKLGDNVDLESSFDLTELQEKFTKFVSSSSAAIESGGGFERIKTESQDVVNYLESVAQNTTKLSAEQISYLQNLRKNYAVFAEPVTKVLENNYAMSKSFRESGAELEATLKALGLSTKEISFEDMLEPTSIYNATQAFKKLGDAYNEALDNNAPNSMEATREKAVELYNRVNASLREQVNTKSETIKLDANQLALLRSLSNVSDTYSYLLKDVDLSSNSIKLTTAQILDLNTKNNKIQLDSSIAARNAARQERLSADLSKELVMDEERWAAKKAMYDSSQLANLVDLRDMVDQVRFKYEAMNASKIGASSQTSGAGVAVGASQSIKTLTDSLEKFTVVSKRDNIVVSPEQIKYLKQAREFLIKNGTAIVENSEYTGMNTARYRALVDSIGDVVERSENFNDVQKQNVKSTKELGNETEDITKEVEKANKIKAKEHKPLLDRMFGSIAHAFKMVIMYRVVRVAVQKLGQAMQLMIASSVDYEQSLANVAAVSSATAVELAKLDKAARNAGETTRFTAMQGAEALYFMAQAGYDATESIAALNGVLVLAQATGSDVEKTSETVAATLSQFRFAASDADKVANTFAASINKSLSSMDKLTIALKQAGPVASTMNVSFEETVGLLDLLFNNGIQGSRAGRALRNSFSDLSNPLGATSKKMKTLGLDFEEVNLNTHDLLDSLEYLQTAGLTTGQIMYLFGDVIGPQMTLLLRATREELQAYVDEVKDTNHAYEAMAIQNNTLRGDMDKLKAAYSSTGATIGKLFTPAARSFMQFLRDSTLAMNESLKKLGGMITMADELNSSIVTLAANSDEYTSIIMRLNSKSKDLTDNERDLLEIRKQLLEIEFVRSAREISENYSSILKQEEALNKTSIAYGMIKAYAEAYEKMLTNLTYSTDENNTALGSSYSNLIKLNNEMGNFVTETLNELGEDSTLKSFRNDLLDAYDVVSKLVTPMDWDGYTATAITELNKLKDAFDVAKLKKEQSIEPGSHEMTIISIEETKKAREELANIKLLAAESIALFRTTTDNAIDDVARLIKNNVIDFSALIGIDPKLKERIETAISGMKDITKEAEEVAGVWATFNLDLAEDSLANFNNTLQSTSDSLAIALQGKSDITAVNYGYAISEAAVKKASEEARKAITDQYDSNIALVNSKVQVNEEDEESVNIANEASKVAAKALALRHKNAQLAMVQSAEDEKLYQLVLDKEAKGLELSREDLDLIKERTRKLIELGEVEIEYLNKVNDARADLISSGFGDVASDAGLDVKLALLERSQQKELDALKNAKDAELKVLEQAEADAITAKERENADVLKLTELAKEAELKVLEESKQNKLIAQEEITKKSLAGGIDFYEKFLKSIKESEEKLGREVTKAELENLNEQWNAYEDGYSEYSANFVKVYINNEKIKREITEGFIDEETDINENHNIELADLATKGENTITEIKNNALLERNAINTKYNSEDLNAEVYFYLQKEQLELEHQQRILDKEAKANSNKNFDENVLPQLKAKYDAESVLRDKQLDLDKTRAEKSYTAGLALAGDDTDKRLAVYKSYQDKLSDLEEDKRQEDLSAEEEYLKAKQELIFAYSQDAIDVMNSLFSAINSFREMDLEKDLEAVDTKLELDKQEAESTYKTKLKEAGFATDEHEEKLKQFDEDIRAAIVASDMEALIKARSNKEKYLLDKEYEDEIAVLEAEAAATKAQLEYESALATWNLQTATIAAESILAVVKAWSSIAWPWNMIPVGITTAAVVAQGAAHAAAKPTPPKLETGGIILGSQSGTQIIAGENNKVELLSNAKQMANLLMAIGNGGLSNSNKPMEVTFIMKDTNNNEQARYTVGLINKGQYLIDPKRGIKKER